MVDVRKIDSTKDTLQGGVTILTDGDNDFQTLDTGNLDQAGEPSGVVANRWKDVRFYEGDTAS